MRKGCFILFLLIVSLVVKAQPLVSDSLIHHFEQTPPDKYGVFFDAADTRLAGLPMEKAQQILAAIRQKNTDPNLLYYLARSNSRLYKIHKDYVHVDSVLQAHLLYTQKHKQRIQEANMLVELGYLYLDLYKYSEGQRYLQEAYQIFYKSNQKVRAAFVLHEIGLACYRAKESNCSRFFVRALALGGDSLQRFYKINSYNTLGLIAERKHLYKHAVAYYQKTLQLALAASDTVWIGLAKGNIGQVLVLMGKGDEALPYLYDDLETSIRYKEFASAASTANSIGNVYESKNGHSQAIAYFVKAIELAKQGKEMNGLRKAYQNMANIFEKEGKQKEALYYLRLYTDINDSLIKRNKEIDIIKVQSLFDVQKKEQLVKSLLESNRRKQQITIAICLVCVFAFVTILLALRIFQKIKINQLLLTQKEELERKNEQLEIQQQEIEYQNDALINNRQQIEKQRDLLAKQNKKLQKSQQIITHQNEEIRLRNTSLEEIVKARTFKLVEYNRQLEKFAFITAHNLRAPVARILGLGEIIRMSASEPEEEKLYIEKLVGTTLELDKVLHEMNTVLEKKQDDKLDLP